MHRSYLGKVFRLGPGLSDMLGVSEAVGTVLLLGISVTLAGAIALWTQTIDEGEQGIYVDLWSNIQGSDLVLTHRGGDLLDGENTYIRVRNSDGTSHTFETYSTLSGTADESWGPGEALTMDISTATNEFEVIVTSIKDNGNPMVIMSVTMVKNSLGSGLPDLAITMLQIRDTNGVVISSGIYEEGPYQIYVRVDNFGADLAAPYLVVDNVAHSVSHLQMFDASDDLIISSLEAHHWRPGAPVTEITGAAQGQLANGDWMEVIYIWNAFQDDPRTLGSHTLNVKVIPHGDGELNYRNNYVERKIKVNKEIVPQIINGPDPGIYEIYFSDDAPHSGDTITVTVVIQNSGDEPLLASQNVNLIVSTWAPTRMQGTNYEDGFEYTGNYYVKESFDWKMDTAPYYDQWRSQVPDGAHTLVYDDTFPTCVVSDLALLPGAYFFYYFQLEARVDVPGGEQRIYVAIDVFDSLANPQGITALSGDDTDDNQGFGTIQVLPRILLVDDDEASQGSPGDMTSSVVESLVGAGVTIDKLYIAQQVEDDGSMRDAPAFNYVQSEIPAPAMEDYDIVIWVTGYATNPFTNRPVPPGTYGGNIQEMIRFMDSNKYLMIVGESPLEGMLIYFLAGDTTQPNPPFTGASREYQDASEFAFKYLGISRVQNDMDMPIAGDVMRGLDTGADGITQFHPPDTQYDIELEDLAPGNGKMQLFVPRSTAEIGFELPVGVTTTQDEIDLFSNKWNMIRATSTPSGIHSAQYRVVTLAWDINQIEYLNEKIDLFAGVLKWFDWKINVGRDLAVTRMELFIMTEQTTGVWVNTPITGTNLPKYLDTVYIEVTVRNNGPSVESTSVMFYVTGPDGIELPITPGLFDPRTTPPVKETFGNPQDISGIAGDGGETVKYKLWLAIGVGIFTFRVVVDPYHLISEVSEENNDITYSTSTVTSFVTQNNILVVDDDFSTNNFDDDAQTIANKGPLTIDYFTQGGSPADRVGTVLDDLNYDHETFVVENSFRTGTWVFDSNLGILDLKRYNAVLWVMGDSGDRGLGQLETLTVQDMTSIMKYLEGDYSEAAFLPIDHNESIMFLGTNFLADLSLYQASMVAAPITVLQWVDDYTGLDISLVPAVRAGSAAGGDPDGDFTEDIYTGIELSDFEAATFDFREMSFTAGHPSTSWDLRAGIGAVDSGTGVVYLVGSQLYRHETGADPKFFRTVTHTWQLASLDDTDMNTDPEDPDIESELHEMLYLTLHWFDTPESKPELLSRNSKIAFDNDNPVLGNSYLVEVEIANVGGEAGGGTVRFTDGNTLIKSENIYLESDKVTTLEAIWTPLYAGDRDLNVWIDRYNDDDEVFDEINNEPYQTREIYFFWDDLESGEANWDHDTTVQMINGEGKLDYMEEPTNSNIIDGWEEMVGFHENNDVGNSLVSKEYHSSNVSYMMHEPSGEIRSPIDVTMVIDTSGSMSGQKIQDARTAAKTFIDQMGEYDRVALYRFQNSEDVWRRMDLTYMTAANKVTTKAIIDTFGANGYTPIWDTIGEAVKYSDSNVVPGRTPAVIALTDGDDMGTNGEETGSEVYAPGSLPGVHSSQATWGRTDMLGCVWGGPARNYNNNVGLRDVTRYYGAYNNYNIESGGVASTSTRLGLIEGPVYVFSIGLGISPRDTTYVNGASTPPSQTWSPFTTEYDLWQIAQTSSFNGQGNGKYYYAPTSSELQNIYDDIFAEIQDLAQQATRTETRAGEVLYYKLDESFGTFTATDSSGWGHTGNLIYSDEWTTSGIVGGALDLWGDNHISIPSSANLDNLAIYGRSINFWINADNTVSRQIIYRQGSTTNGITMYLYNNRLYAGWVSPFTSVGSRFLSIPYTDVNNWHMITFLFDGNGGVQALYIDAVPVPTSGDTGYIGADTSGVYIGSNNGLNTQYHDGSTSATYRLDGTLDEFRIYNFRMLDTDVTDLFERALTDRNGLRAEYYTFINNEYGFNIFHFVRTEGNVDYNYGSGAPSGMPQSDRYAIRWTGYVVPLYSEVYTFYTYTNDGVRLYVNDIRIINDWETQGSTENSGQISLTGNTRYKIVMEFFKRTGDGVATLSWSSGSQSKEIIPATQLFLSKYTTSGGGGGGGGSGGGSTEVDPNNPWSDGSTTNYQKHLLTKPINLRYVDTATLSFYQKYNLKVGSNGGVIQIGIAEDDLNPAGAYKYLYIQPDQPYTGNTLTSAWPTNVDDAGVPMRWAWNGKSAGGTMGWEYVSVNLDRFIGHYIKVKFLYVYNYGGSGFGWMIDDVMVKVSSATTNPDKDLSVDNWNMVKTTDKNGRATMAWWNGDPNLGDDLKDGIDNSLYTRPIDLTNARSAHLYAEFKFNIQTDSGRPPDGFRVEISIDNGVSWVPLSLGVRSSWDVSGTEADWMDGVNGDGKSFTGLDSGNYWVASHSMARLITNLEGFVGNTVILRFRVVTNTDGQHYEDPAMFKGIYIDNIVIFGESLEGSRSSEEVPGKISFKNLFPAGQGQSGISAGSGTVPAEETPGGQVQSPAPSAVIDQETAGIGGALWSLLAVLPMIAAGLFVARRRL